MTLLIQVPDTDRRDHSSCLLCLPLKDSGVDRKAALRLIFRMSHLPSCAQRARYMPCFGGLIARKSIGEVTEPYIWCNGPEDLKNM